MVLGNMYDSLIIGGGPAGLSVALGLGRVNRTCAVFSHSIFRNDGVEASHSVLGLDDVAPQQIREQGIYQIERYGTTTFIEAEISQVAEVEAGGRRTFVAMDERGRKWAGKTLVMATGVKDVLPKVDGYAENWPRNIYQCLFCDGWERRNMTKGILCVPSFNSVSVKLASMAHHLDAERLPTTVSRVTIFSNGDPNPNNHPILEKALITCYANRIKVDTREVVKLVDAKPKEGVYVFLRNDDGSEEAVHVGFLVHKPATTPNAAHLIEMLGLEMNTGTFGDYIKTESPFQSTSVQGIFSAGDAGVFLTQVSNAMLTGVGAAGGVTHYLNEYDDAMALEAYLNGTG
ncbi:hypothetical protein H072_11051 [Neofusicoccum parvum]|uniref:Uncharacterized protein n=1 Tax=Neofusicoccum parvum TaxID=310453 RepID=A0ACB5S1S4_9PEZI|nr:hypothetical protein H072_11051 [Neofusicoccum parvum]